MHNTKKWLVYKMLTVVFFYAALANAQTTRPDAEKQLAHDIYKQFIEVQSGFTTGATTPVAEAAAARLKAAGFSDSDIFVGGAIPKKANLVVRYHGTGAHKPILLLAHTDVVEAKREDWSMDPFQFIEKEGFFYGRGTGDDKAQAAVWIANLIQYKREGFKPDRDIIVALTADEEGGGPYNGVDWLLKNHRELIDADFALNEGGWGEESKGKKISNDLQVSEKYVLNFRFEVRNKGGHSSMPVRDNAIYHLAGALQRLGEFGFPLETNEVTAAYQGRSGKGRVRFAGRNGESRCGVACMEFHSAHHLRRHDARRRPRHQCASATRSRHGELSGATRRLSGIRPKHVAKSSGGRSGQRQTAERLQQSGRVPYAAGCPQSRQ
jgi:acetylornithine deacetylase/succinyl-diaminopimelate desuccinylase-like protein